MIFIFHQYLFFSCIHRLVNYVIDAYVTAIPLGSMVGSQKLDVPQTYEYFIWIFQACQLPLVWTSSPRMISKSQSGQGIPTLKFIKTWKFANLGNIVLHWKLNDDRCRHRIGKDLILQRCKNQMPKLRCFFNSWTQLKLILQDKVRLCYCGNDTLAWLAF